MTLVVKFDSIEELLEEIKSYFKTLKDWGEEPDLFNERKNLRSDILTLGDGVVSYNGETLCEINIEIGDFYLDEILSKYEPELWASIEDLRN